MCIGLRDSGQRVWWWCGRGRGSFAGRHRGDRAFVGFPRALRPGGWQRRSAPAVGGVVLRVAASGFGSRRAGRHGSGGWRRCVRMRLGGGRAPRGASAGVAAAVAAVGRPLLASATYCAARRPHHSPDAVASYRLEQVGQYTRIIIFVFALYTQFL